MSDLPAKQSFWLARFFSGIFRGYGKKEDKPTKANHGANWNNPYGVNPGGVFSPAKAMSAYGGHGYTFAAVSRSAADLAALPLKLIEGKGKSSKQIEESPVLDLLDNPSSTVDGYLFREQLRTDLMLSGNCYILLLGLTDKPDSIIRLHPDEVEIITDESSGITGYSHSSNGNVVLYPPERVLHGRTASYAKGPQGLYGIGVIQPLSREISADINAQKLASTSSAKGRPDILIHPVDPADVWGLERRREILDQYNGLASEGGAMVLSGQVGIEPLKLTPREMEFEASRRMARESISAATGCPPTVLGLPDANYATSKNQKVIYWSNQQKAAKRLDHLFTQIAQLWNSNYKIVHDFSGVEALQSVRDAQLLRVQQHIANGIPAADAYAYEGMADIPYFTAAGDPEPKEEDETLSLAVVLSRSFSENKREDEKKKTWYKWIERSYTPQEKRLYRASRSYLIGASKRYSRRLRRSLPSKGFDGSVTRAITDWSQLFSNDEERRYILSEIGVDWIKGWRLSGSEELTKVYRIANRTIPEDMAFGADDIAAWQTGRLATELIKTTNEKVRTIVEKGLIDGLSTDDIARQISQSKIFDKARATLIARTEATRSINSAHVQAYEMAAADGISVQKQWMTADDDDVRLEHQLLDGQTVFPSEMFTVSGMEATGPGEFGSPAMDCNCRCTVVPFIAGD